MKVLVTGAAGFIGGAVAADLRSAGHEVVALDAYIPQAHKAGTPQDPAIARGDVRDIGTVSKLLIGVDVVCHQAAMVGAGVTPSDLPLYAGHNDLGTATLLAAMADTGVDRLVFASSMVVYGDGCYTCPDHGDRPATRRGMDALRAGHFDVGCPLCGRAMTWRLVGEETPMSPQSSYAASKAAQEHFVSAWARQVEGVAIALRYHNVYGPHMPAHTPYSGVAAIFRSSLERGEPPSVFEDGAQMRDFVHVSDVAAANLVALAAVGEAERGTMSTYNVGSGWPISISEVARLVSGGVDRSPVEPRVTGEFRAGDVRHLVADSAKANRELGFTAATAPAVGLVAFAKDPLRV